MRETKNQIYQAQLKARISQTRRIQQHQKDVWGKTRDDGYFKAEIKQLMHYMKKNQATPKSKESA